MIRHECTLVCRNTLLCIYFTPVSYGIEFNNICSTTPFGETIPIEHEKIMKSILTSLLVECLIGNKDRIKDNPL